MSDSQQNQYDFDVHSRRPPPPKQRFYRLSDQSNSDLEQEEEEEVKEQSREKQSSANQEEYDQIVEQLEEEAPLKTPERFRGEQASQSLVQNSLNEPMNQSLSQDFIAEVERSAKKEKKDQKHKRRQQRIQRQKRIRKIQEQNDKQFRLRQKSSVADLLRYMMDQTLFFINFIMGGAGSDRKSSDEKKSHSLKAFQKFGLTKQDIQDAQARAQNLTRLVVQPKILKNGTLKDYQLDGLNWMINLNERGLNGILADQMGLGKTIQTISLIAYLRQELNIKRVHLVVGPLSTISNWQKQFAKWCPEIRVFKFRHLKQLHEENQQRFARQDFDVIICSYQTCCNAKRYLRSMVFESIVLDQAHRIKNENTILAKQLRSYKTTFRLLLTGTPLQNNLHELWALLNYLFPEIFGNSEQFDQYFNMDTKEAGTQTVKSSISQLHKILRPFMLRRTKKDVERSLPPKKEFHITVPLSSMQIDMYKNLIVSSGALGDKSATKYRNILVQLRKVCCHPYLFPQVIPNDGLVEVDELLKCSGKLTILDKMLSRFYKEGRQVLIFSQFLGAIDVIEYLLYKRGYQYCTLVGDTDMVTRQEQIDDFTKNGSSKFAFVLSTRAGGLGINLMTANKVIIFDSDFNPQSDLQAMDRAHRIGQKREVHVYRLITENTVEQKIIQRQTVKLRLDALIIQQGRLVPKAQALSNQDNQNLILHSAESFIHGTIKAMDVFNEDEDEKKKQFDLDEIIANAQKKAIQMKDQADKQIKQKLGANKEQMNQNLSLTYQRISCIDQQEKDERLRHQQLVKDAYLQTLFQESDKQTKRQRKQFEQEQFPDFYLGIDSVEGRSKSKQTKSEPKKFKIESWKFYQNPKRLRELADIGQRSMNQEELDEFKALQLSGFRLWKLPDVRMLIKAIGKYGQEDEFNIIEMVVQNTQKTIEQVQEYLPVFIKRKKQLEEDNLLVGLNKAIISFKTKENQINVLSEYCNTHIKKTLDQWPPIPRIQYVKQADASYSCTAIEDNYILRTTNEIGYGKWDQIVGAMSLNMSLSKFLNTLIVIIGYQENYLNMSLYLMSRSPQQISQRVNYLLKMLGAQAPKLEGLQDSDEDSDSKELKKPKPVQKKTKNETKGGKDKILNGKTTKRPNKYSAFENSSQDEDGQAQDKQNGHGEQENKRNLKGKAKSKQRKK